MSKNVFANGREISGKKDDNKSICSMPDVCLSPPSPPAGPVPIPYPNTAVASDTSDGSKSVLIGGGEVGLKNASNYKKSTGDEAATKTLGMGVVSHNIQGKLKHAAWSMDVQIEGKNVIRHMDMVTQNHMNSTNAVPGIDLAAQAPPTGDPECVQLENEARQDAANDTKTGKLESGKVMTRANVCGSSYKAATPMDNVRGGSTKAGYLPAPPMPGQTRELRQVGKRKIPVVTKLGQEPNIACSDKRYRPQPGKQGGSAHTEAKVIQKAYSEGCQSITLRTNWNDGGNHRNDPCPLCQYAICVAAKECNITIMECREETKGGPMTKKNACDKP